MSIPWQRWTVPCPRVVEALELLLFFAVAVSGVLLTETISSDPPPPWTGVALCVLACAALHWRRTHPLPVLAITLLCSMGQGALDYFLTPLLMCPLIVAQYVTSVRTSHRTTSQSTLAVTVGIVVTALFLTSFHDSLLLSVVNPVAWVLLSAALGSYVRVRREYAAARAEHAARDREEEARRRVMQERMRIARELHDVVAHHLTLASAQAGIAAHLSRTHPDQAFEIIDRLRDTTTAALDELKATVGLLRQESDASDDLAPAPGLGQLPDLVAASAAAGLKVAVTVEGAPHRLPPGLDLTAYRVVQEALTNVTKHAATHAAQVRITHTAHSLTLAISNDTAPGRSAVEPAPGHGFGLLGMRERTESAGGTLRTGPRPDGGFEVVCTLPLTGHDDESPAS